jgi:hypothetical protein
METCESRAFGIRPPATQFAQLYCFVRELPADSSVYHWDNDNELSAIVSLSRLVHPTTVAWQEFYECGVARDTGTGATDLPSACPNPCPDEIGATQRMLLEAVAEWRAGMPPAPFLPGGFKLLREKSEGRLALVFVRCTRMSGGEAESKQFRIIHRAEVCAEGFKVDGTGPKHCMLLSERLKEG